MRRTPLGTSAQWPVNRRKLRTVVARRPDRKNALQIRTNGPAEVAVPGRLDRASHARGRRFETRRAHRPEALQPRAFVFSGSTSRGVSEGLRFASTRAGGFA